MITISEHVPTWINHESTFESVPLSVVIKALERQYGLVFKGQSLSLDMEFSGGFPHNDMALALRLVFEPLKVSYKVENNRVVVIGERTR